MPREVADQNEGDQDGNGEDGFMYDNDNEG